MDALFLWKVAASFLIGGGAIAAQLSLAERSSEHVAGILLSFPSTMAISFFFIGLAGSPMDVAEVARAAPAGTAVFLLFNAAYARLARLPLGRVSIPAAAAGSLAAWAVLAWAAARFTAAAGPHRLQVSLAVYAAALCAGFVLLTLGVRAPPIEHAAPSLRRTAARAAFCGSVIASAVVVVRLLGPCWGAMFATFPAALLSGLLVLHARHGGKAVPRFTRALPAGSVTLVVFALAAMWTFPRWGNVLGLAGAWLASAASLPLVLSRRLRIAPAVISP